MTTTPPIIYSVGTLVEVDNTKTGYIIEIEDTNDDIIRFKISYLVGNEIEEHVYETRCRPVSLRQASSTRSGIIQHTLPQSTNPPPLTTAPLSNTAPTLTATPPIPIHTRDYQRLQKAMKNSRTWIAATSKEHPLYEFLKSKKKEEKGWIFEILPISLCDKKSKQIQGNTKVLYLVMTSLFSDTNQKVVNCQVGRRTPCVHGQSHPNFWVDRLIYL